MRLWSRPGSFPARWSLRQPWRPSARGLRRRYRGGRAATASAAGLLALIARGVIGDYVVDQLAQNETVRPAAGAVWSIGTSLLSQTAIFLMIDGLFLIGAAALAGPTPIARSLRGLTAPVLRDRPVLTYAFVAVAFLLLLWWGPTLAFREPISLVVIAVLMVVGTESLRRQVAREFPDERGTRLDFIRGGGTSGAVSERVSPVRRLHWRRRARIPAQALTVAGA